MPDRTMMPILKYLRSSESKNVAWHFRKFSGLPNLANELHKCTRRGDTVTLFSLVKPRLLRQIRVSVDVEGVWILNHPLCLENFWQVSIISSKSS